MDACDVKFDNVVWIVKTFIVCDIYFCKCALRCRGCYLHVYIDDGSIYRDMPCRGLAYLICLGA